MNINLTLFAQILTFGIFIWFTVRFVWPPLLRALEDRRKTIADGLAAAERGRLDLAQAEKRVTEVVNEAKVRAAEVIANSDKRAAQIVEEAKLAAKIEGERLVAAARADIELEANRVKEQLRAVVAELAVAGAGRILEQEIDRTKHARLLDSVVSEL